MPKLTETEWIWRDGEFIRWQDATVNVLSHSMQYGSSAFEGIRCYKTARGPAVFRLEDHLQRLLDSCKMYRMDVKYTIDELVAACCELIEKNKMEACYIRPMVLRGYGASSMVPFDSPIEVYMPCWPWGAYLGEGALENGVDACVTSWQRVAPNTIPAMAKMAGNYLSGQLVKMEALRNGFAEGIALSPDGLISGKPLTTGTYDVNVVVHDSAVSDSATLTLSVDPWVDFVSTATFSPAWAAPQSMLTAVGWQLSAGTATADPGSLPTILADTTVTVRLKADATPKARPPSPC